MDESQLDSISIELGGLKWDFDGAFRVAELELGLRTWTGGTLRPLLGCQEGLSLNMHPMKLADFSLIYGLVNMSKF